MASSNREVQRSSLATRQGELDIRVAKTGLLNFAIDLHRAISSVGLERYIDIVEVRGSNPLSPTDKTEASNFFFGQVNKLGD